MAWQVTICFISGGVPNTEGDSDNPSSRIPIVVETFGLEAEADQRIEAVSEDGYTVIVDGISTIFSPYALLYTQKEEV